MATTENKATKPETVKIMVPIVPGQANTIHPCVNGEEYTVMRGEYVEVPWYIAEAIENSLHQQNAAYSLNEKLKSR